MEAKDTVINYEQRMDTFIEAGLPDLHIVGELGYDILLKKQAEISFKAGQQDIFSQFKSGEVSVNDLLLSARRAGIGEVVKWLFERSTAQETDFTPKLISFTLLYSEWQDKLKSWNIGA